MAAVDNESKSGRAPFDDRADVNLDYAWKSQFHPQIYRQKLLGRIMFDLLRKEPQRREGSLKVLKTRCRISEPTTSGASAMHKRALGGEVFVDLESDAIAVGMLRKFEPRRATRLFAIGQLSKENDVRGYFGVRVLLNLTFAFFCCLEDFLSVDPV
jgi:hypothetical protein